MYVHVFFVSFYIHFRIYIILFIYYALYFFLQLHIMFPLNSSIRDRSLNNQLKPVYVS